MDTYATVVLAAGKGTRMHSALPKVLHPLAGVPLLAHVLKAVEAIPSSSAFAPLATTTTTHRPIVVLGYEAAQIEAMVGKRYLYVMQEEQLGTGHAVLAAQGVVDALDPPPQAVLVCYGDNPLVTRETLARVLIEHFRQRATVTFFTAIMEHPSEFGRVVLRDASGRVHEIVEKERANEEQKRGREINSGVYCFDRSWLWTALHGLPQHANGEYYLTDLIHVASSQGLEIATVSGTVEESIGVNDRVELAAAEQVLRRRILERHMYAGVTIIDPAITYIDEGVTIGVDTVILPGTMITGKSRIGSECRIGPETTIDQSVIGDRCIVRNSIVEESTLEDDVRLGPWSRCRNSSHLAHGVGIGNFVEIARSSLGSKTEMNHFGFVGDATIGEHVNIGAGVVTVNYDGKLKHRTTIGKGAFIGCDTMLIAPVEVGDGAITGAGAVVNKDVPARVLVVGVPARVLRKVQIGENSMAEDNKKE